MKAEAAGISRKQFLALSPSKQKKYLKDYPQSSHRFLLEEQSKKQEEPEAKVGKKGKKEKKVKEKKVKESAPEPASEDKEVDEKFKREKEKSQEVKKREFSRFMTKAQFALLSDEDKAAYLDKFKSSSHREKPPRIKPRPSRMIHDLNFTEEELASMQQEMQDELASMNTENRASINRESITNLNDVSTDDLKEASEDIRNHSEEIAGDVAKRFQNRPRLFGAGLAGIRKLWSGEEEPSPSEKKASHRVMSQSVKLVLLGTGIIALAATASPLAMIIGAHIMESYGSRFMANKDKKKDDALDKLKEENSLMKQAERDRKEQLRAQIRAQKEEEKRREEQQEETEDRLEEAAETDQTKSDDGEPLEPKTQESEDGDSEEEEEGSEHVSDEDTEDDSSKKKKKKDKKKKKKMKAESASHKNDLGTGIEYTHEDDFDTIHEIVKNIGQYLEDNDADTLRDHARVAYGKLASSLVSESSATYNSIDDLASAVNGQVEGNFVVTASARYEYNETTGRYGHAKD